MNDLWIETGSISMNKHGETLCGDKVELAGGGEFICSRHGIDSELAPGDAVRVLWEPDKACPVDVPAGKGE
mgnify:CR=1 FL=1